MGQVQIVGDKSVSVFRVEKRCDLEYQVSDAASSLNLMR
jgi:hypothetical protein